jgi:hypothetical protein
MEDGADEEVGVRRDPLGHGHSFLAARPSI